MLWSFILAAIGVFGLYLAGRGDHRGWMVGIGAQFLWATYAIVTNQWGFLVSCFAYGWVYTMPLVRRWREKRDWVRNYESQLVATVVTEDGAVAHVTGYSRFDTWLITTARRFRGR